MTKLADQDLGRSIGRLEQQAETAAGDIETLTKRAERLDDRVGRVERGLQSGRAEMGAVSVMARATVGRVDGLVERVQALEKPIAEAKASASARRVRMRARIKQIGGGLVVIFGVVEWVAKPIVGYLAEQWVRGFHPPIQ